MTKAARKYKSPKRKAAPKKPQVASVVERLKSKRLLPIAAVVLLAGIPFSMGKYIELNSPGAFDSGAYVYSARHILEGAEIGVEEKPSAQLGTLLVNMLGVWLCGYNETGPKLVQMFMQSAALVLMFIAMRRLFGMLPAAVGVIVASVCLSAPLVAKVGNVKEQYMIACMVMGVSCFVLRQITGKWWLAALAGAFLIWAPLFKQTGTSAIGAVGLFVILQPLLKNRTWKQTGVDVLLLLAGAATAIGPLYVWILAWDVQMAVPYSFVWQTLAKMLPAGPDVDQAKAASDYVTRSRKLIPFSVQWPRVLRHYGVLILPISLAVGAIIARLLRMIRARTSADVKPTGTYDRFVLLLAAWWVLDMAFVWISPRSYEQYYLPLIASAAMLGGYLIAVYGDKLKRAVKKDRWIVIGLAGLLAMIVMSWHIFFGLRIQPFTGRKGANRELGYAQSLRRVSLHRKKLVVGYWENVGNYMRAHSNPTDKVYVWGWVPGIYVAAQRFSSASKAFCMPRPAPQVLAQIVDELLAEFRREMPKFIVDTRKRHQPTHWPPYELWPIVHYRNAKGPVFLPLNEEAIARYETEWSAMLRRDCSEDEAARFEALAPFRKFIRENYEIAELGHYVYGTKYGRPVLEHEMFGEHVLFRLKNPAGRKEPK